MKKNTVKKIFIFFLIFLPLQYAAVGIVGLEKSEPWPAFVLPAFQNADATPKYISVKEPVLSIADSAGVIVDKVPPNKIFIGIQESQIQGFFRTHFSDSTRWEGEKAEARKWLANCVGQLYPSSNLQSLNVYWVKRYYNFSSNRRRIDSARVINEFSISLRDESN